MSIAEFKIHDNISIFVGAGVAFSQIKEEHYTFNNTDNLFEGLVRTSKRKCGFTYKVGFDIKATETFSLGITYQSIKAKIKFDDTNPQNRNRPKATASSRVNNIMLSLKYHF